MPRLSSTNNDHFVAASIVAAELHKATSVARDISLTAGNAKALALRAGDAARGFRALTDFIDELARLTISTARHVNKLAVDISREAADATRTQHAIEHFVRATAKATDAHFAGTLKPALDAAERQRSESLKRFDTQVWQLKMELDDLARELRAGVVLSAMSRVEATQVGEDHAISLQVIANKVAEATESIRLHIETSQKCFAHIH
ncbi:chemotaxis protein [Agaribacterium haliotis]|uniref:chemotaxis protein n=1 Tax=Agaribacterium haliotis TaxID=2013869 RepID=UPI001177A06F|nr:chemotaxis protein [Agaribacterium haliotis]